MSNLLAVVLVLLLVGEAASFGTGLAFGSERPDCPYAMQQKTTDAGVYPQDQKLQAIDQDIIDLECKGKSHDFMDFFHWFPAEQVGESIGTYYATH